MKPRALRVLAGFLLASVLVTEAHAAGPTLGIAAPLTGASATLGAQIEAGAGAAALRAGVEIAVADDACTAEGGRAAAEQLVAAEVTIVVGFLCTEAIEAALPLFKEAGIPVVTPGVRTDSLTDRRHKTGWPVYRLGPRADGERQAVAAILTRLWRDRLFAIVDDGTIYGRELAESFRLAAEQAGLKPVFVDTYRPQLDNQIGLVGRLRKAGATHVFVGGDFEDIAIIARDAGTLDAGLVVAGGETLRAAPGDVPLSGGVLMVGLPEWADVADPAIVSALKAGGAEPDGYVLPAHAAAEIAIAAAAAVTAAGQTVADALASTAFATAIGPVKFDDKGDLAQNPFRIFRYDGSRFVALDQQ